MSAQLGDAQLVELRPILHRFFAAGQRLGDGFKGHALFCQRVQLLKLFAGPRLPVSFKPFGHFNSCLSESAGMGAPSDCSCRSEEHTSELQSLMRSSYAVFCLKKKKLVTRPLSHTNNNN